MKNKESSCLPQVIKLSDIPLTDLETALLQNAHHGYAEVILEQEFGGGYSGTRVFLMLPVHSNGIRDARVVTKIGPAHDLSHEFQNYEKYVGHALTFAVAQVQQPFEQAEWAALNYVFVGNVDLGKSLTLEEYYHTHTATQVIKILEDLFNKTLGPMWYLPSKPLSCSFREEYGHYLPSHQELEESVQKIFPKVISPDGNQVTIPGISSTFPNPLHHYADLLDKTLMGRKSFGHGDLHLHNILVDESDKAWLIDFAKVGERHNLFDFIKLEVYIRLMALAKEYDIFSLSKYVEFERDLIHAALGQSAKTPSNPKLKFAYQVILSIREIAGDYMVDRRSFKQEYLPALFLYTLAMLKYHAFNGDMPTRLIFITSCILAKGLSEDEESQVSEKLEKNISKDKESNQKKQSTDPERAVETSGGVYIEGDINVQGDFIGRDQLVSGYDSTSTVLPCHICGKLCHADEVYRCKRCEQFTCASHRPESGIPFCPDCAKLAELERQLSDRDDNARLNAIQLLSKIGDASSIGPIERRIRFELNASVRYWLFYTLGHIGGREVKEILQKALRYETNVFARRGIEEALQMNAAEIGSLREKINIPPLDDGSISKIPPGEGNSCSPSERPKRKFRISIAYPRLLSKRFESSFLLQIYFPEKRSQVMSNIDVEFQKQESNKQTQLGSTKSEQKINEQIQLSGIRSQQKIKVKLFSPVFDFPEPVTKLIDEPVNKIVFLGMPKDNCEPGFHKVLISILDANTDQEFESVTISAQVVDFAFDHVSRPMFSKVSAIVMSISSFVIFILTFLEQIDKTFGLTSGTAAGVFAAAVYANFYNLYQRRRPNIP